MKVETANGIIINEIYEIEKVESLGIVKSKFKVQVYDFVAHGIMTEYDGVIGLDFLRDSEITIDFRENRIRIK